MATIVSDSVIFPDMYNTGANTDDISVKPPYAWTDNTVWLPKSQYGINVEFRISSDTRYLQFNLTPLSNGSTVTFENIDFRNASGATVSYLFISRTHAEDPDNSNQTKDVTIKLINCVVPEIRAVYGAIATAGWPKERVKWELHNCTCYGVVNPANLEAHYCKFVSTSSDCIRALLNCRIENCYAYNPGNVVMKPGDHVDIFQTTPVNGHPGESLIIHNFNVCHPGTPTVLEDSNSGCIMLDLDYADYNGIDIDGLYANGGAYSIYMKGGDDEAGNPHDYYLRGKVMNIEYGYGQQYTTNGTFGYYYGYNGNMQWVQGVANYAPESGQIRNVTHPFVGTVKTASDKIQLYVTNYLATAATITIKTNSGEYSRSIAAYPLFVDSRNSSNGYSDISKFPVNKLVEVPLTSEDTYVDVYYNGERIRRQVLSEAGEGSDIPEDDDPTPENPDTTDKQWRISQSLLTGLGDAFREVGAEGKLTLLQMADMVRQFGSSAPQSDIKVMTFTASTSGSAATMTIPKPADAATLLGVLVKPAFAVTSITGGAYRTHSAVLSGFAGVGAYGRRSGSTASNTYATDTNLANFKIDGSNVNIPASLAGNPWWDGSYTVILIYQ